MNKNSNAPLRHVQQDPADNHVQVEFNDIDDDIPHGMAPPPPDESDDPAVNELSGFGPASPPRCDHVLAAMMLHACLGQSWRAIKLGLYILVAPSIEWISPIAALAEIVYLQGTARARLQRPRIQLLYKRPPVQVMDWHALVVEDKAAQTIDKIKDALTEGKSVMIVTTAPAGLPATIRAISDRQMIINAPTKKMLAAMIAEVTGETARPNLKGMTQQMLTPQLLNLAYRKGTTAADYVQRLRSLVRATTPAANHLAQKDPHALDRLHGMEEAKRWATELDADLTLYRAGQLSWADISDGLLLNGPPGTGKTQLAQAIAGFCGLNFIATSYADWQAAGSGHLGDVVRRLRDVFAEANAKAPCLLFIDEIDSVGSRGQSAGLRDWWRTIINALLEEMDGAHCTEGVVLVAATNHPNLLDPALLRSGRLEHHIAVKLPSAGALADIYRDQLAGCGSEASIDFALAGRLSVGISGADAVKISTMARRRARNAGRSLQLADLTESIVDDEAQLPAEEQWRIALHEAGHAVAALSNPALTLDQVTIVRRGVAAGGVIFALKNEASVTPAGLDAYLVGLLAGRAAEEVALGTVSSGAGGAPFSDLAVATRLAADAETSLGFSELVWSGNNTPETLSAMFARQPQLRQTVSNRLDAAYGQAKRLVMDHLHHIKLIARELMTRKVLMAADITEMLQGDAALDGFNDSAKPMQTWLH